MAKKVETPKLASLVLLCGEEDYLVKQRGKALFESWLAETQSMDQEKVDGTASNSGEAIRAINRLHEALQTLPFFGGAKLIWFQNCTFLSDDRTGASVAVTEALTQLAETLTTFRWESVRLLITGGKVDKRRTFYKTLDKIATVEVFNGLSVDDRDWTEKAEQWVRGQVKQTSKEMADQALSELVLSVGPNLRMLQSELEKLVTYVGARPRITSADIEAVTTKQKQARAFALSEAMGDRNLAQMMRHLDAEFWAMKGDSQRSEMMLLGGLIAKLRMLVIGKALLTEGYVKAESDYQRFKSSLEGLPPDLLPDDKRYNPVSNAYPLYKAVLQSRNFAQEELATAMSDLLQLNLRLVSSNIDPAVLLSQALVKIVKK